MIHDEWNADGVRLILGDCLDCIPLVGPVDAVVTDPPYGIGEAAGKNKSRGLLAVSKDYGDLDWDNEPARIEHMDAMHMMSKWQIIFGGNYFPLPPSRCWLVWDKLNGDTDFADCELAWTNLNKAVRRIAFRWHGMIRDEDGERIHPTQKPIGVILWCLGHLPAGCDLICDPFMGVATTGVACIRAGKRFIGIEREPSYFKLACERIAAELNRAPLFEQPKKLVQRTAFGGEA